MRVYITQLGTEEEAKERNWSCSRCEYSHCEDYCLKKCIGRGSEGKPFGFELAKFDRWYEE